MRPFRLDRIPKPRNGSKELGFLAALEEKSFDLEIGCGVGWHPITYAKENPLRALIAIEKTANKFKSFESRLLNNHPENLLAVHADAVSWTAHRLRDRTLQKIFFLYPNPSPKNHAQRWIRMPYFGFLLEHLASNGEVQFATNMMDYAEEVRAKAIQDWGMKVRSFTKLVSIENPRTHFEKKYLKRGETCFDIILSR